MYKFKSITHIILLIKIELTIFIYSLILIFYDKNEIFDTDGGSFNNRWGTLEVILI